MTDPHAPAYYPAPDPGKGMRIFVAIAEFTLAALCALALPFVALMASFAASMPAGERPPTSSLATSAAVYTAGTAFFITMGVGTIRGRRWARALMVVASSLGLAGGIVGFIAGVFILPYMFGAVSSGSSGLSGAARFVFVTVFLGVIFLFYVLLPGGFLAYYARSTVREEFERLDPEVRWTDLCPLPVLAVALVLGYSGVASILMACTGSALPFFGHIIKGSAMIPFGLLLAAANALIGWKTYRLEMVGWWGAVGLTLFWCASFLVTLAVLTPEGLFAALGSTTPQMSNAASTGLAHALISIMGISALVTLGYLGYVRRYFFSSRKAATTAHSESNRE